MNNLINKFRTDKINAEELETLRRETNDATDKDLGYRLENDWMGEDMTDMQVNDNIKYGILDYLNQTIKLKKKFKAMIITFSVAASLLCIIALGAFYLRFESNLVETPLNFTTTTDEYATVQLPDDSEIKLGENSILTYFPSVFKKSNREIEFKGEGYFKIFHNEKNPFTIKSGNLIIKVKGTEFNLSTGKKNFTVSLYLVEGLVEMSSLITKKNISIRPGELAVYNEITGEFNVSVPQSTNNLTSWYTGEIRFDNEPLQDVLSFIETYYDVKIRISSYPKNLNQDSLKTLRFNGTLPSKDLQTVITALENVYGIKIAAWE